jgi:hypothetical protein
MSSSQTTRNDAAAGSSGTGTTTDAISTHEAAAPTQSLNDAQQTFSSSDRINYNLREDALGRRDAGILLTGNADVERGDGTSLRGTLINLAFDADRELHTVGNEMTRRRRAMLQEIIRLNDHYTDEQLVTFVKTIRGNRG